MGWKSAIKLRISIFTFVYKNDFPFPKYGNIDLNCLCNSLLTLSSERWEFSPHVLPQAPIILHALKQWLPHSETNRCTHTQSLQDNSVMNSYQLLRATTEWLNLVITWKKPPSLLSWDLIKNFSLLFLVRSYTHISENGYATFASAHCKYSVWI